MSGKFVPILYRKLYIVYSSRGRGGYEAMG
jgi:hypothetical protein